MKIDVFYKNRWGNSKTLKLKKVKITEEDLMDIGRIKINEQDSYDVVSVNLINTCKYCEDKDNQIEELEDEIYDLRASLTDD